MLREAVLADSEWRATWVCYRVLPEAVAKLSAQLQTPAVPVRASA
ncbi:hypothetical protein [Streptomyces sp. NPDC048191]